MRLQDIYHTLCNVLILQFPRVIFAYLSDFSVFFLIATDFVRNRRESTDLLACLV